MIAQFHRRHTFNPSLSIGSLFFSDLDFVVEFFVDLLSSLSPVNFYCVFVFLKLYENGTSNSNKLPISL